MMGEPGRIDEVAKYDGKVTALAFQPLSIDERSPRDRPLGLRSGRRRAYTESSPARITELRIGAIFCAARRARGRQVCAALVAEARTFPIFSPALCAAHKDPFRSSLIDPRMLHHRSATRERRKNWTEPRRL